MQSNIDIIRQWYKSYSCGEIAEAKPLFADNLRWQIAAGFPCGDESPFEGKERIFGYYFPRLGNTLERYFEDWQLLSDELLECGNKIVSIGRYVGRSKGSSESFTAPFVHIWELHNGQIARLTQYTDTWIVRQAMDSLLN